MNFKGVDGERFREKLLRFSAAFLSFNSHILHFGVVLKQNTHNDLEMAAGILLPFPAKFLYQARFFTHFNENKITQWTDGKQQCMTIQFSLI